MITNERAILKAAGSGLLLSLWLEPDDAAALAVPGGEPPERLHCTICYMGKQEDPEIQARVAEALRAVVYEFGPVTGTVGGIGRFNASESSDGEDVFYASFDSPLLPALRQTCLEAIERAGVPVNQAHGYSPHITLSYLPPNEPLPAGRVPTRPITFTRLTLTLGEEHVQIPLEGTRIEKAAAELAPDHVDALRLFGLSVVEKEEAKTATVKVLKADEEQRLVYGVVLEPLMIDTQDQVMTAEDVQYAAHHYMGSNGIMGLRHKNVADAVAVESYVAPCDFEMGGQTVLKGSWVLVSYVRDDVLWQGIKDGTYNGYSVGGFGALTPIGE